MKIDSHQHFWRYSLEEYDWIDDSMSVLRRDFLPEHLAPVLAENDIDGCIAVQARQSEEETEWLLELARKHPIIKGVIGWTDLRADDIAARVNAYKSASELVGFRHVLQGEPDPEFMLAPEFVRGVRALHDADLSYDILIFAKQLKQTLTLVDALPEMRLIVDHIAKPDIANGGDFKSWAADMRSLSAHSHVGCKVSGMVTEANWTSWAPDDFHRYLDVIFDAFGVERILFGSDWPVCLVAGEYPSIRSIVSDYVEKHCPEAMSGIFGGNAMAFYKLGSSPK